ncbi:alpha/beta hydrolase, partial [Chloroflexota bacterium]
ESYLRHYFLEPMAARGVAMVGADSRYTGLNHPDLRMENVLLDLGQVIRYLHDDLAFENIILLGNSGGGPLSCYYQSQAENPTIDQMPSGDPVDLGGAGLIAAKAVILINTIPSRAKMLTDWMDPAVVYEDEPFLTNPELDMFNPKNGPPYSTEFVRRYCQGQRDRNDRITCWAVAKLEEIKKSVDQNQDIVFTVYRTNADLRSLDLNLEPSDREPQSNAKRDNLYAVGQGRVNTLRCWLSTWGLSTTYADGPENLSQCSVPSLIIGSTADRGCWISYAREYYDAAKGDKELVWIKNATHYFVGQQELLDQAADNIVSWLRERQLV